MTYWTPEVEEADIGSLAPEGSSLWRNVRSADPVRILAMGTFAYIGLALVTLFALGHNPIDLIVRAFGSLSRVGSVSSNTLPTWLLIVPFGALILSKSLRGRIASNFSKAFAAFVLCSVFLVPFNLMKTSMPSIVPFWADGFLTELDVVLHFGHKPHSLLGWLAEFNVTELAIFYIDYWLVAAYFFPALIITFDPNVERQRVFVVLWMAVWVVLGNLIAVTFMSYGPIFADTFAEGLASKHDSVMQMLARGDAEFLNMLRMYLWTAYSSDVPMIASGISAFPSVHVGMAALFAIYVLRCVRDWSRGNPEAARLYHCIGGVSALGALTYLAVFQVLSVYLGWHYAVDGYVSVLVMCALYFLVSLRMRGSAGVE